MKWLPDLTGEIHGLTGVVNRSDRGITGWMGVVNRSVVALSLILF